LAGNDKNNGIFTLHPVKIVRIKNLKHKLPASHPMLTIEFRKETFRNFLSGTPKLHKSQ